MKNVEYFNLPDGSMLCFEWCKFNNTKLKWHYHQKVDIEYVEHNCKQSILHRLFYGKLLPVFPILRYSPEYFWQTPEELYFLPFKESILEICRKGKKELATEMIFELFNHIIESCPSDNVVVFGYNLNIIDGKISPEIFSSGHELCYESISCGFAGY